MHPYSICVIAEMLTTDDDVFTIDDESNRSEKKRLLVNNYGSSYGAIWYRWVMLAIVSGVAVVIGFQHLQFLGTEYQIRILFKVSGLYADILQNAYNISFIVMGFPILWLVMESNFQFSILCATGFSVVGSIFTAISLTNPNFYDMAVASQYMAAIGQVFLLCLPCQFATSWFDNNEVTFAAGIFVFFYQVGNGLALLPPLWATHDVEGRAVILTLFSCVCAAALLVFNATLFCSESEPRLAPSQGRRLSIESDKETTFLLSIKDVITNWNFALLVFSYGIDMGIFNSLILLYKDVIVANMNLSSALTDQLTAFLVLVGTPAALMFGFLLDRTKEFIVSLNVIGVACVQATGILYFATTVTGEWMMWLAAGLCSFGFTSKMLAGIETAAEVTYPVPACVSTGVLMISMSVFTSVFVPSISALATLSDFAPHILIMSATLIGFLLTCFMKPDWRRLYANGGEIVEMSDVTTVD